MSDETLQEVLEDAADPADEAVVITEDEIVQALSEADSESVNEAAEFVDALQEEATIPVVVSEAPPIRDYYEDRYGEYENDEDLFDRVKNGASQARLTILAGGAAVIFVLILLLGLLRSDAPVEPTEPADTGADTEVVVPVPTP